MKKKSSLLLVFVLVLAIAIPALATGQTPTQTPAHRDPILSSLGSVDEMVEYDDMDEYYEMAAYFMLLNDEAEMARREQMRLASINYAQEQVTEWILQNRPLKAWQLESLFGQIERYWFPNQLTLFMYGLPGDLVFSSMEVVPHQNCVDCDRCYVVSIIDSMLYSEEIIIGGLQLSENQLQNLLVVHQQLNPYIIGIDEIMLDDGTFIYEPIYADGYNPIVFSGPLEELHLWAEQNQIDIQQWDLGYSCPFLDNLHLWAEQNQVNIQPWSLEPYVHEVHYNDYRPVTKHVTLNNGGRVYFTLMISPLSNPGSTNGTCQREGCTFGNWTRFSSQQHVRTCTRSGCGFQQLDGHAFSFFGLSGTQHRRTCSTCGHSGHYAHTFGSWTSASNHQCQRSCLRCTWLVLASHNWQTISSSLMHHTMRCRTCSFELTVSI